MGNVPAGAAAPLFFYYTKRKRCSIDKIVNFRHRKAIFFAFVHAYVLMGKLTIKRSCMCAKWHGRRSETVDFLGLTGSMFLMAREKVGK